VQFKNLFQVHLGSLLVLFIVLIPPRHSFSADACFDRFSGTKAERIDAWRARSPEQMIDWLESVSHETTGLDPKWITDLRNSPKSLKGFQNQIKSLKSKKGPTRASVVKLMAQLYRFSLVDLAKQLIHDPEVALDILAKVPDRVLVLRLERAMMTKGAVETLASCGLLREPTLMNRFADFLGGNSNSLNIVGSMILSAPAAITGIGGLVLPKINLVSDRILVNHYATLIQSSGFQMAKRRMIAEYGASMRDELRYDFLRQTVNYITIAGFVYFVGNEIDKEVTLLHRRKQEVKVAHELALSLKIAPLASADQEAENMLKGFEDEQRAEGKTLSPLRREQLRIGFRNAFHKAMDGSNRPKM
jgi:hypothetical protein